MQSSAGCLTSLNPKYKEKVPIAILKSWEDEISHGSYLTMVLFSALPVLKIYYPAVYMMPINWLDWFPQEGG